MKVLRLVGSSILFCGLWATVALSGPVKSATQAANDSERIDVMFYNVYNLFDARHDEGKDDWTFLPHWTQVPGKKEHCEALTNYYYRQQCLESDWNEKSVAIKLNQLTKAITDSTDRLPDLLGLAEVENEHIVGRLAKKLGYQQFVMGDSPDVRGIDVALLYQESKNLRFVGFKRHVVPPYKPAGRPTRNILEVEFNAFGKRLLVFVNHWPSQNSPSEYRVRVARQLKDIVNQRSKQDGSVNILIMGDFNTIDEDFPHPFHTVLLNDEGPDSPALRDAHLVYKDSSAPSAEKKMLPFGTYYYARTMSWNRLDRFFFNRRLRDGHHLEVVPESYRILATPLLTQTYYHDRPEYFSYGTQISNTPYRANIHAQTEEEAGFSDHFPIFLQLRFRNGKAQQP